MKTAFLFSGQGAQYPGMLKELYENEAPAREVFDCANKVLNRQISQICFCGSQEELNLTHNTQPSVLACDLAVALTLKAHGIEPNAVAGFSLGEYAALVYAEAMNMEDAFRVIQIRADSMQEAVPIGVGSMAAIKSSDIEMIDNICKNAKGYVIPANLNSPIQTVISGTVEGVEDVCNQLEGNGIKTIRLNVSAPFHCALMEPAALKIYQEFKNVSFHNALLPVYMNVDAQPHQRAEEYSDLLVRQAMSPVHWRETIENMHKDGVNVFIECGPGKTLSGFVKKTLKDVSVFHVEDLITLDTILTEMGKA